MAKKHISLIFIDSDLNLFKVSQVRAFFASWAPIFARIIMKIWLVVKYYLMNKSVGQAKVEINIQNPVGF